MITLDDDELFDVMTATKPLQPKDHDPFLRTLAAELEKHRNIEPGLIHRLVRETQPLVFDPPQFHGSSKCD